MIDTILFDLSEVFIPGLLGVEDHLAEDLDLPSDVVLDGLLGDHFRALMRGQISEDEYIEQSLQPQDWPVTPERVKALVRHNVAQPLPGMQALLRRLAARYDLVLVSDHAFEWVDHIRRVHRFLGLFRQHFFSCDLGRIKRDPGTFDHVLREIDRAPERCFFIDDNPKNIAAAAEAGIAGVVFESAAQLEAELRRRGLLDGEAA